MWLRAHGIDDENGGFGIVPQACNRDASAFAVIIDTSGSSSSADASVIVANSSGPSSRRHSLYRCSQILAPSVVVSNTSDALSIPRPLPTPLSSSLSPHARLTLLKPPSSS